MTCGSISRSCIPIHCCNLLKGLISNVPSAETVCFHFRLLHLQVWDILFTHPTVLQPHIAADGFAAIRAYSRTISMAWTWRTAKVAPTEGQNKPKDKDASEPLSTPDDLTFEVAENMQQHQASSDSVATPAAGDHASSGYRHTVGGIPLYFMSKEVNIPTLSCAHTDLHAVQVC